MKVGSRGYWNPKSFPTVAVFASLNKEAQGSVAQICKRKGIGEAIYFLKLWTGTYDKVTGY